MEPIQKIVLSLKETWKNIISGVGQRSACQAHVLEVAGSNPAPAIQTTEDEDMEIEFKSRPDFYEKEEAGLKPNTVRFMPRTNPQRAILYRIINDNLIDHLEVRIRNSQSEDESFVRKVRDISFFRDHCIISWEHPIEEPEAKN